ncbi:hypothetical protein NY986_09905, partial [Escherichia coli]
ANRAGINPLLKATTRIVGQQLGKRLVQALAVHGFRNLYDDRLGWLGRTGGRQIERLIIEGVFRLRRSEGNVSQCVV